MPIHDWGRAEAWRFHDFHSTWLIHLKETLNAGRLPAGYEAFAEQRAELYIPDVLTLTDPRPPAPHTNGAVAVAEPRADRRAEVGTRPALGRALTVRHASGRRVVAIIEVVSPRNKDREASVGDFAGKIAGMLAAGVHAAVIDVLPPGRHDPGGMHPAVWSLLEAETPADRPPPDRPLTFAGYRAAGLLVAYLNYAAVGAALPPVPLFLDDGAFVDLPLEETYMTGFTRLPPSARAGLE